jgi:hypothetical protein
MKNSLVRFALAWLVLAWLWPLLAADSGHSPPPAKVNKPVREADLANLTLTAEAEKRLGVTTTAVVRKKVERVRRLSGELILPSRREQDHPLGEPVDAGLALAYSAADLLRLAQTQIDADGQVEQAKVQLEAARAALRRAEQLLKDQAGSARAVDEMKVQTATAEVALRTAQARRELLGPPVQTAVNRGMLWVRVPVYVGELSRIQEAAPARVGLFNDPPGTAGEPAPRVAGPPSANAAAGTVDLFYALPPSSNHPWRLGQKVAVTLSLREEEESLVVPWSAVIQDVQGGAWVYEKIDALSYARRRVEIARVVGTDAVLSRGVQPGAAIVSAGAAELYGTEFGVGK